MNRLDKTLLITVLLLGGILWLQHRWTIRLTEERDRFRMNSTALLSDVKRMQIDSATMVLDAKALRLTIDEYKEFRAKDAETIERLGVKIRNLEVAARHEVEVKAPIDAAIRDTAAAEGGDGYTVYPTYRVDREQTAQRRHQSSGNPQSGGLGRIQGMVVLEACKGYPSVHFQ